MPIDQVIVLLLVLGVVVGILLLKRSAKKNSAS